MEDLNINKFERMTISNKEEVLMQIVKKTVDELKTEESFYIADLSDVIKKYKHWKSMLPRVYPFYAIKANHDLPFIRFIASLGMGFDCSNKDELKMVLELGVSPSRIIFAHTFKLPSHLDYAREKGIDLMTFDSEEELYKIKEHFPSARLVLRFIVPNTTTDYPLANKFGCKITECRHLLKTAQKLELSIFGTCFHVGGLCKEPTDYSRAIEMAREVFNIAEEYGYKLKMLDIGGGFFGHLDCYEEFDQICNSINQALDDHFSSNEDIEIIAEPGTYFAGSAFTLCTPIFGKKKISTGIGDDEKRIEYYLYEGMYGSFFDKYECYHTEIRPLLLISEQEKRPKRKSKLWGYTCSPDDLIKDNCLLPEMNVGEYLVFTNMGAYTTDLISQFNGFPMPNIRYIFSGEQK